MIEEPEIPIVFGCNGDRLVGILQRGREAGNIGVVIVVGGPQYRVGSHRQFVLMARALAAAGYPVLRFDYRGMGDSEGAARTFERIDKDIRSAIDALMRDVPGIDGVVLAGLCDAASASMMYGSCDDRVDSLILINPWARTEQGEAKSYLKHYYGQRLLQKTFWAKIASGEFQFRKSLGDFCKKVLKANFARPGKQTHVGKISNDFLSRMLAGVSSFTGSILLLTSGRDVTAQEFMDRCWHSPAWVPITRRNNVVQREIRDADHTFSSRHNLDSAVRICVDWLQLERR